MSFKEIIKTIAEELGIKHFISDVHGKYLLNKQTECFNKGNKELITKVDEILTNNGLQYWLNYGTLLGAYRDHAFIKHDYDLDIGMWWKDRRVVKDLFINNGFRLVVEFRIGDWDQPENVEYRFEYAGAFIDVDFYTINEEQMAYTFNPAFKEGYDYSKTRVCHPIIVEKINNPIRGLKQIDFIGGKFWIPSNAEEYLIYNYGEGWKTPVSVAHGFNYHNVANNIEVSDMKGWVYDYR